MKTLVLLSETYEGEDGQIVRKDFALCTKNQAFGFTRAYCERKDADPSLIKPKQRIVRTEIPVNVWLDTIGDAPIDLSSVKIAIEEE